MIPTRPAHRLRTSAACLLLLGSGACATLIHGTTQDIPIFAPVSAAVAIDGVPVGTAPMTATVSRRRSHLVTFTKDSAPPIEVELRHSVSGWVWANAFIDYLPAIVDFADGAAFKFNMQSISVAFPGREASDAMLRAGLAVHQQIRFNTHTAEGLVNARVDSCTMDRLYVHTGRTATSTDFDIPSSVAMRDIRRIDVQATGDRWAPHEARRIGSPLLVDDELRVSVGAADSSVEGNLATMDSIHLLLATHRSTTRLDRTAITSMQRRQDHDYAAGARRALVVGAIIGGLIAAQRRGNMVQPDGPSLMRGGVIGAVYGLALTPLLAPGKWVEVRRW